MPDPQVPRNTLAHHLRRLDLLSAWQAWALGLGVGTLAGAILAGPAPRLAGVLIFLGLLGAAALLVWSGEPVAVTAGIPTSLIDWVPVPGGTFYMGSPAGEEGRWDGEGPVHEVRVSPFDCMRYPVTRRLYQEIHGTDPSWPPGEADDRPVNNVSWFNAVVFCNQLSRREGLDPCYRIRGKRVSWNHSANGYRLLTEAEWEYACRAGSTTRWSFGDSEESLGDFAWFDENSFGRPQPVGRKRPNDWGLYDMHGNVFEWCWDWFGPYFEVATTDPNGPPEGQARVLKGGAFEFKPAVLRSAVRFAVQPGDQSAGVGFRCARSVNRPS